ncbi:MAG: NAD(+)/NADH kinase [Methanomicrobia archaeon]|nr:NAD(+)/NADH kinase [Methanomicrobia archaeon]MCK4310313.1 NAD(+)/NADH kinase [Methanomicrobia archaeon]MCK4433371.1 NAD(+)/NADH kinase [Methanomicrobia archaeon]
MKIGIVSRADKKEALDLAKKIIELLDNHEIFVEESMKEHFQMETIKNVDFIVAVGGDGTILRTVGGYKDTPVLPVNMGTHGYLTEINPQDYQKIPEILENHRIEERSKLVVIKDGKILGEVLNEVIMRAKEPTKVANFLLRYDNEEETIFGDGVIVATPTGSTAYSLSAGGPVVHIKTKATVITPLASLNLKNHPKVVPDNFEVKIKNLGRDSYLVLDGVNFGVLKLNEEIIIKKSENTAKFVRI